MKLPKSFGKPKRPKLLVRRISGMSMSPTFRPNQIIIASGWFHSVDVGNVVIINHRNLDKIKRIERIDPLQGVFVVGDNASESTDSRSFGWVDFDEIIAKVHWPNRHRKS